MYMFICMYVHTDVAYCLLHMPSTYAVWLCLSIFSQYETINLCLYFGWVGRGGICRLPFFVLNVYKSCKKMGGEANNISPLALFSSNCDIGLTVAKYWRNFGSLGEGEIRDKTIIPEREDTFSSSTLP